MTTFLRSLLITVRYDRNRYLLVHPGSSSFVATDWLGTRAAWLLRKGLSTDEVARRVEERVPGAGERFRTLATQLVTLGAMSGTAPSRTARWYARVVASVALGGALSLAIPLLRRLPIWALHAMYEAVPRTLFGRQALGQSLAWVESNLRVSGIAADSTAQRTAIARERSAAVARMYYFVFMCGILPAERFRQFLARVVDLESFQDALSEAEHGGSILVCMHTDLYLAVPVYLRTRGVSVSTVADVYTLGAALGTAEDIRGTFPAFFPDMLTSRGLMSGKTLLQRLQRGEAILVAIDAPPQREEPGDQMPTVGFLGRRVRSYDGPAWLAARSGLALKFCMTYRRGGRTVVEARELHAAVADVALPAREHVERLTSEIYRLGEEFVRRHPESWTVWSYFHTFGEEQQSEESGGATAGPAGTVDGSSQPEVGAYASTR